MFTDTATHQTPAGADRAAFLAARDAESSAFTVLHEAKVALAAAEKAYAEAQARLAAVAVPLAAEARADAVAQGAVFSGEDGAKGVSEDIAVAGGRGYVRVWLDDIGLANGIWWAFLWDGGCASFFRRCDAEQWVLAQPRKAAS